ncbi:PLP-dependent aminotransferase family protein [Silvimonas soli]|uniref:MocR-like pyridoxine biosynthesis transcription factor PdxR n=1 Tax=Silvimonas soli TaxID=2980100 RepID=UPI0024B38154|nr:PLP-dependent aminotransferase family protein [Silvimonas soli]
MDIHISIAGRHDLIGQIYRQLRAGILDGRLAAGERLPSTRDLAVQLGVSRKTTLDAFERLIAEGYLRTRTGEGTFVADSLNRVPVTSTEAQSEPVQLDSIWDDMPDALAMPKAGTALALDFKGGMTDKSAFPFESWRRCINHALRLQARGRGEYHDPAGEQELRLAVSRYLAFNRAVVSNWQDVIITQGAQQALDLLARVLIRPGDTVAMEDPGYPPARACFTAIGARVVSVPVDEQGLVTAKLPAQARLVYVTPSHQFPLGMPMSLERRVELLEWAQQNKVVIVEDDYDGEFRFEGRPMESLKSLDRAGLVAYVWTFSKTIFPELRVGYVVPPLSLKPALQKAKQIGDCHSCTLTQAAVGRFILNGDFTKHLRRMHKHYETRRAMLLAHLHGDLATWFEPIVPAAGIHLTALLKPGLAEETIIAAGREVAVGLYGISGFHTARPKRPGILFGYGGISAADIDQALGKLAHVLRSRGV